MQETWVRFLGREDPLEKEMATHSSTLAWKLPWLEEPGRLSSMGSRRVGHNWATSLQPSIQGLSLYGHGFSLISYPYPHSNWDSVPFSVFFHAILPLSYGFLLCQVSSSFRLTFPYKTPRFPGSPQVSGIYLLKSLPMLSARGNEMNTLAMCLGFQCENQAITPIIKGDAWII